MSGWLNKCHFGDVRDVLRQMIADGIRVDTIVTSPPYWGLRNYGHDGQIGLEPTLTEFIATMVDVFDLCRQVLRDDGAAWVNMGDSYLGDKQLAGQPWRLAFALQDAGWYLRQDIVWHKPNPMPESVRDRCTKAHEYLFLLAGSPRYYFDAEAIKEPVSGTANPRRAEIRTPSGWDTSTGEGGHGAYHKHGRAPGNVAPPKGQAAYEAGDQRHRTKAGLLAYAQRARLSEGVGHRSGPPSTRTKRSVWTVGSEPYSGAHFATFPTALIEPCILAGSRPGGVVLDPFFGSGTTGQVAQALGRHFIGIEINEDYKALQDERLRQPSLFLEAAA